MCCVVENLSRVFLSEWPLIHLWVMRVYIVWVNGREVTLKKPPGKMFHDCLARLFNFQSCAPHMLFRGLAFRELLVKSTDSSFKLDSSPT